MLSANAGRALLNALAAAFLVAMAMLYFRQLPPRPALEADGAAPEN